MRTRPEPATLVLEGGDLQGLSTQAARNRKRPVAQTWGGHGQAQDLARRSPPFRPLRMQLAVLGPPFSTSGRRFVIRFSVTLSVARLHQGSPRPGSSTETHGYR